MSSLYNKLRTTSKRINNYTYPNTTPIIQSLSPTESALSDYTICYINGLNFSKENTTGNTTVTFGDIKKIPVTFYSSLNISFVVPNNLPYGVYNVQVVNNNYPTSLYSNILEYNCIAYPIIYTLSPSFSPVGYTTTCFISGVNFSNNSLNGFSTVTFGNLTNIPVIFYNNSSISFEVPSINIGAGIYNVQVVNNNNHFNNYSNILTYELS
jgi:hypothetical protein